MTHQRIQAALILCAYVFQLLCIPLASANPTGPEVVGGQATVSGLGTSHVTITQASQRAIINWQQFNIAPNEVTQFIQPNVRAIALNRILDQNPTQILGSLRANGTVILLNQNGVLFGPNAQVNVGGLIASSLNISNANFMAGHYLFQGTGIEGQVTNMGAINASHDGVYLLAPNVVNSGVIRSPQGNIVLAAGATAYLSNRPDGRGFLAELKAPVGQALNLGELVADGGRVTLAGRVVNQSGLVQANSVRQHKGKIELYASESLTLGSGSRTLAKGGQDGVSHGGTILAIADKQKGSAIFERGATIDVSGGAVGGHAGFVELSGSRVGLGGRFIGTAKSGYRGGRLLIDPTMDLDLSGFSATDFLNIAFETPRDALGNLLPDYDLRVTGFFDLNSVQPPSGGGTITFEAGRDLIFKDLTLWNNPFGAPAKWDIVGVADRHILFTGNTGSTLQTAHGGSINLWAKTGDVNLSDGATGALSTIRVQGGGGLSIKTGRDLFAATGFDEQGGPLSLFNVQGINIDGPGRLNLDVGRDFLGGFVNGVKRGPGFVLWNTDQSLRPHHTVNVGGKIGERDLDPQSSRLYADFALSGGDLNVKAGGNVYLRRVRDAGLVGGLDVDGNPREPAFSAGFEKTKVSIVSQNGDIILNTNRTAAGSQANPELAGLSALLPASLELRAENGSIQIHSGLTFLPSPTGSVKFFAKHNIQGVLKTRRVNDDNNYFWLFVGPGGAGGGQWVLVDKRTIPQHPEYFPYLNKPVPKDAQSTAPVGKDYPEYARIDVEDSPHLIKLMEVDPNDLVGRTDYNNLLTLSQANNPPLPPQNTSTLEPVSFIAEQGNISKLFLDLVSRPFRKEITIEAGNRIEQTSARIYLPDLGTETKTVIERIPLFIDPVTHKARLITKDDKIVVKDRDPVTGLVKRDPVTNQELTKNWNKIDAVLAEDIVNVIVKDVTVNVTTPKIAATITAKDIILDTGANGSGEFAFSGSGTARVIAKNTLDLANGRGISLARSKPSDKGGLLDIAVGNSLEMVTSGIFSRNGAGISIHGYDEGRPYVVGYDNSALYPLEFPDSLRGGMNLPAAGGRINVGENSPRSQGLQGAPTGIQVFNGGSTGQMARQAVVNQDGSVTVNIVKDPAAILIRAKGDIDVNKSRIATFGGGDIRLTSPHGNINAGSGSKNERVNFPVDVPKLDAQGNPIIDPNTGDPILARTVYQVPGSGIFTFHPNDPQPLVFPKFNDPEINALLAQADREGFLGRDVSALNERANQLRAEREPVFNETVLNPYFDGLKLGNITLTAERGNIIIPPAGIRGRDITLIAPRGFVDFRGGALLGRPTGEFPLVIGTPNIPVLAPPGVAPPPPPLSGGGAAAAASTTAVASSNTTKNTDKVQETVSEASSEQARNQSDKVASKTGTEKDSKSQLAKSLRVKRGVVIQVDVKPQQGG
jgi:filamentous hemagglutinin family protein